MEPPSQLAKDRPISFVLHDTTGGGAPVEVPLVIRPEDLSRTDTSRLAVTQTLGGAWADNFGPGIPAIQISGHTGWGAGDIKVSGEDAFKNLYSSVYTEWHHLRELAIQNRNDPDKVKLIFLDMLDDISWVVAPQTFVLRRNKSRPLLFQYQINLTFISGDVKETLDALAKAKENSVGLGAKKLSALDSLLGSIKKVKAFIVKMRNGITSFLGPIKRAFDSVVEITDKVLYAGHDTINQAKGLIGDVSGPLIELASDVTRAAANLTSMVRSVMVLPMIAKGEFIRLGAAFENAYCVLTNVFKPRRFLPNYDDLYGASYCSSTSGGSPISRYDTENPFVSIYPLPDSSGVKVSASAAQSIARVASTDVVLHPMAQNDIIAHATAIGAGIEVAA